MMDACVSDSSRISCGQSLKDLLLELVEFLNMDLLDGPRMTEVHLEPDLLDSESDEGGITGYCLITTSHLSIHTWPLRKRFCLDVFSCKPFDGPGAADLIRDRLGVEADELNWIERRWPQSTTATTDRSSLPAGIDRGEAAVAGP